MALAVPGSCWRRRENDGRRRRARAATNRPAILLALVAAVGFGTFFVMLDRAEHSADLAWLLFLGASAPPSRS